MQSSLRLGSKRQYSLVGLPGWMLDVQLADPAFDAQYSR